MPDVAARLRSLGDEVFDDVHKSAIGQAAENIHAGILAKIAEAKAAIAQHENTSE